MRDRPRPSEPMARTSGAVARSRSRIAVSPAASRPATKRPASPVGGQGPGQVGGAGHRKPGERGGHLQAPAVTPAPRRDGTTSRGRRTRRPNAPRTRLRGWSTPSRAAMSGSGRPRRRGRAGRRGARSRPGEPQGQALVQRAAGEPVGSAARASSTTTPRLAASLTASLIRWSCWTRAPTYRAGAGTAARSDSTTELRPATNSAASPEPARRPGRGAGRGGAAGGRAGTRRAVVAGTDGRPPCSSSRRGPRDRPGRRRRGAGRGGRGA